MRLLSIEDFQDEFEAGLPSGSLVLDVRSLEEFEEFHIDGAKNIPHVEVGPHADELNEQYKHIYVLCRRGARAQVASSLLIENNSEVESKIICVNDGGMERWSR
jgi:rhodanese-related sulfurtransferase